MLIVIYFIGVAVTAALILSIASYLWLTGELDDYDGVDVCGCTFLLALMGSWLWPAILTIGPAVLLARRSNARKDAK